jgi:hypothetical protein
VMRAEQPVLLRVGAADMTASRPQGPRLGHAATAIALRSVHG